MNHPNTFIPDWSQYDPADEMDRSKEIDPDEWHETQREEKYYA